MAPQKILTVGSQQQPLSKAQQVEQPDIAAKPRKKKAKQQQQQQHQRPIDNNPHQQQPIKLAHSLPPEKANDNKPRELTKGDLLGSNAKIYHENQTTVVPSERTSIKKQLNNKETNTKSESSQNGSLKPIVSDEIDDIDAGIELDGSSNSGSSVKDINELNQIKSTSASPVMAQSNVINEANSNQAIEVENVEQMTGLICSRATKKPTASKQQLAAKQLSIEEDEKQLMQKLSSKLMKTSLDSDKQSPTRARGQLNSDKRTNSVESTGNRRDALRKSLPSQSSQETQDGSSCKICDQHVYQMERILAEKSVYHKHCFRCHQCKIQLNVNNYSSHEGLVYCKAHHRQIFQPQVKLDDGTDVDIVAKSTYKTVDEFQLRRGRLSLSAIAFLQPKIPEESRKRQMIICENEPAALPEDVVRSDTKVDDGIGQLNLNLSDIKERFEKATVADQCQPSSAGVIIEKPTINLKKTLMAFESKLSNSQDGDSSSGREFVPERPVVKKLANFDCFLKNSQDDDESARAPVNRPTVKKSGSILLRLKKYESRIAGEQVEDESDSGDESISDKTDRDNLPKRVPEHRPNKIDLSALKNQWETGDINKKRSDEENEPKIENGANGNMNGDNSCNGNSPLAEKNEELCKVRQLARKKIGTGAGTVRNIYENAIKEQNKQQAPKRDSSDLSALKRFSTSSTHKQLFEHSLSINHNDEPSDDKSPTTPTNKDHIHLNLSKKANKLKEMFELGLVNNASRDDSDASDAENGPALTKLEQIRQEKMEDLSVFTEGEITAREARNMFQQIDRSITASNGSAMRPQPRSSLTGKIKPFRQDSRDESTVQPDSAAHRRRQSSPENQPIRLTNNVRA